ncbi:MAG: Gfo/Idh/MocA family oxidoreductase [Caulobacteraceae bacterium]|nr:Gfo/Idh/MocA family oxidoreductase [Caulobacteraceae bacterium]
MIPAESDAASPPRSTPGLPRVAVVGAGHWGKNLVRNFGELGALAAVVDPDLQTAQALAASQGAVARDLDAVLADPAIQAVAIAAPAPLHHRLAKAALQAGKHVFVEKPVALTLDDAADLIQTAETAGLTLMVGHLLQYHPVFLRLKAMVEAGELGRVRYIYSNRLSLGKIRREEDVLWSFAPHDISMVLALAGEEPDRVTASGACMLDEAMADSATVQLAFPSGRRAHVFVSWASPFKEQKLVVIGDDAMAVFDDTQPNWDDKLMLFRQPIVWRDGTPTVVKGEPEPVEVPKGEPLKAECSHFLECVASGRMPRTDGAEGLRVLRVLTRASEAMARDRS